MRLTGCAALVLSALLLLAPQVSASCQETRKRHEWRDLSKEQQLKYVNTVKAIMKPANGLPSTYDLLSKMHGDNAAPLHVHAIFLPWHRWFILQFENALRQKAADVTLTYWDWGHDSQEPQAAPIWGDEPWRFGKNGDPEDDNCVKTGAFATWQPSFPEKHCLKRVWRHQVRNMGGEESVVANTISALVSSENLNMLLVKSKSFPEVAQAIELAPHGMTHNNMGGDMLSMYSPNDPLFFLHHTNIDRLWDAWQKLYPNLAGTYGGRVYRSTRGASLNDDFIRTAKVGSKSINFGDQMRVKDVMNNMDIKNRANGKVTTICVVYEARKPAPLPNVPPPPKVIPKPPPAPAAPKKNDDEEEEEDKPAPPRRPPPPPPRPPPPPPRRPPPRDEEEEEEEERPRRPPPQWGRRRRDEDEEEEELVAALKRRLARLDRRQADGEGEKAGDKGGDKGGDSAGDAAKKETAKANKLFTPEGMSKEWLAMNGIKESEALTMQVVIKETTEKLNKLYHECGFIPPDSEIGNRDTCIREMKKKENPRVEFIVNLHGKKVILKVYKHKTPEKNYEDFVKLLAKKGLYMTLNEECGKKLAKITGKPLPGVANKKIETATANVAPATLPSLKSDLKNIKEEAKQEAKQAIDKAAEKSPSAPLAVTGAAGKDGTGKSNAAAEKLVQKNAAAATEKQNEVAKAAKDETAKKEGDKGTKKDDE